VRIPSSLRSGRDPLHRGVVEAARSKKLTFARPERVGRPLGRHFDVDPEPGEDVEPTRIDDETARRRAWRPAPPPRTTNAVAVEMLNV